MWDSLWAYFSIDSLHSTWKIMLRRECLKRTQWIWSLLLIAMASFSFPVLSNLIFHIVLVSRGGSIKLKLKQIKFPLLTLAIKLTIKCFPLALYSMSPTLCVLTLKCTHACLKCVQTMFEFKKTACYYWGITNGIKNCTWFSLNTRCAFFRKDILRSNVTLMQKQSSNILAIKHCGKIRFIFCLNSMNTIFHD